MPARLAAIRCLQHNEDFMPPHYLRAKSARFGLPLSLMPSAESLSATKNKQRTR